MTDRRRILIDARLPWGSGIGRYVCNIVPPVAARLPETSFVLLVAPADAARAAAAVAGCPNVHIQETGIRPFSMQEQLSLPALARGYDLTWFTNYWVPLRWRGRFVATVHDLIHLDPAFPASPVKRLLAVRAFARIRSAAAHVIFVSRFTARAFERRIGAPPPASVVHHGIDHAVGPTHVSVSVADPNSRKRMALTVGAAKEHKNIPLLLEAWQELDVPDWRLVVVTPADDLRSSIDLAKLADGIENVEVLRGIGDAELDDLYARAGFVVIPSRYEGFGLPLLEAMRAGAPVISSTADALVEVASGALIPFVAPADRTGWVQAMGHMVAQYERHDEAAAAVVAHNAAIAQAFTWDRAAELTAGILTRALAN